MKFALDGYALDYNGDYPGLPDGFSGIPTSNDYLGQLFSAGETQFRVIFWVKDSPVCTENAPIDPGRVASDATGVLGPGQCHWAYMSGQKSSSHPDRALLLDPFLPDTTEFDPDLWDRKAIVLEIDGSAKARRWRISDNQILDDTNQDILSAEAEAWKADREDPMDFLVQPRPR